METLIWKDGDLTNVCSADLPWFSRHFDRDNDDYKTNGIGVYLMFGQTDANPNPRRPPCFLTKVKSINSHSTQFMTIVHNHYMTNH